MAREPGEKSGPNSTGHEPSDDPSEDLDESGALNVLPELMRRVFSAGLSSFFLTEEAIRKALGDTLPQDWSDFAIEQSDRTRAELFDRLSVEGGEQSLFDSGLGHAFAHGRRNAVQVRLLGGQQRARHPCDQLRLDQRLVQR